MKESVIIIPSRIGSTRLARKPLINLGGKTLIRRVHEGAAEAKLADKVIVATDDEEIEKEVLSFGGEVVLSPKSLKTGTDRVAWVVKHKLGENYRFIVNVQGDEPMVKGEMIDLLVEGLAKEKDEDVVMTTLKTKFEQLPDLKNPSMVKVICDKFDHAIYFSRNVIPYAQDMKNFSVAKYFKHLGYYCYRREFLLQMSRWEQTFLEKSEMLEQLRILENGYKIKVLETNFPTMEINDEKDLLEFSKKFQGLN